MADTPGCAKTTAMMIGRRSFLFGVAMMTASPTLLHAQDRGLPPAVKHALRDYPGADVASVRVRRDAPTNQGFMYEVSLVGPGQGSRIIYVDPDDGRVLYETGAGG